MEKYSKVTVREQNNTQEVQIGAEIDLHELDTITSKWQALIDTTAQIACVPSALIMRLNEDSIEVFLKSETKGNPYKKGEKAELIYGLYCETVIGTQEKLLVPNALKSEVWSKNNPDVDINMISYLGFPINWPNGEVFGTVCLLDNKENIYSTDIINLLTHVKDHIEKDLNLYITNRDLVQNTLLLEQLNNTKSIFLSIISHDIRGSVSTLNEVIKLLVHDFDKYDKDSLLSLLKEMGKRTSYTFQTLEDLLYWSKNELINLKPNFEKTDVIQILEKILSSFEQNIHNKEINLLRSYKIKNLIVETDVNMITVIFRNLISNAIKYSSKDGEICISVSKVDDISQVTIKDTGIGMSKEKVEKLFTYDDGHSTGTNGELSAGIGLMLTKEFIKKLNYNITVSSNPGIGSSFKVTL